MTTLAAWKVAPRSDTNLPRNSSSAACSMLMSVSFSVDGHLWMWRRQGLPLVPALEEGASEGDVPQGVHEPGGRRCPVDLDPLGVEGEDCEDVAVPPGARRRPGADVARRTGVVRELEGARRQPLTGLVARASWQFGDVARNVHHRPVPEAADRGRFGVVHRDDEAFRPRREAAPGELRGLVLAACAEDAADLWHRQLLTLVQVAAGQRERGRRGKVFVGVPTHLATPS